MAASTPPPPHTHTHYANPPTHHHQTGYWDYQHREVTKKDLGHTCRECRRPFTRIGEALTERRGARTSSRYHSLPTAFAGPIS